MEKYEKYAKTLRGLVELTIRLRHTKMIKALYAVDRLGDEYLVRVNSAVNIIENFLDEVEDKKL